MMEHLINQLIQEGYLKTLPIIEAFRKIKREDFVPEDLKNEADINAPLPIGYGATISQPLTVAFMLELLQPAPGDRILDIGSGSGWQTAMLAYIVGNPPAGGGRVFAIERIPELVEFGKNNVAKYNFIEKGIVEFVCDDGAMGFKEKAPFNKIIAAASAEEIPVAWKEQLKIGGRLVTPVKSSIWLLIKKSQAEFEEQEFPGFAFVPLISDK
jgi:protein-L-isoaspartate(D-aspartate) O-methyltransferase